MFDKDNLKILRAIFTDNINYPFDGSEEVVDFDTFIYKVLSEADSLYTEENYYREYPQFEDFLYSHQVDSIAYGVYIGDIV